MAIYGRGQMSLTDMNDVVASPTAPLNPSDGALWFDTINSELKVYSNNSWSLSSNYDEYVQSRGENLVTNGTGLLGSNYNFSSFTFDGSQVFAGGGSFYTNRQSATFFSDELIPVDVSRKYKVSAKAKSKTGLGHNYIGVVSYDIDKNMIEPYHHFGSQYPVTTLAQDLKVGDTKIYLTSSTGFMDNSATPDHRHSIIFWGYKNSYGYTYPTGTYSRTGFYTGWNVSAIDRTTHVITLNKPFNITNPNSVDGIFKAGQEVSPTSSGGTYQYTSAGNVKFPNTSWGSYEGFINGNGLGSNAFPYGTSFVKLLFLLNRSSSGGTAGDECWLNSLSITDATDVKAVDDKVIVVEATLGNMANDNLIEYNERKAIKDKLTDLIGYVMADATTTLPTVATMDAGTSGKGTFHFVRKNAQMAGLSVADARYVALQTAWDNASTGLKAYLESLPTVKPWDLSSANSAKTSAVTKATFRDRWLKYYQAELDLANATADQLKKNVDNVVVGGANYASNGDFTIDITKSLWASSYVGQVKEVIDISTERPPFKYALRVKNTTNANAGIFQPTIFAGASAEALVNKEITISFWAKYSGIVQGVNSFNRGRLGELSIEGEDNAGVKSTRYFRASNINADSTDTTSSETYYFSGTDTTWKKYVVTHKLLLPPSTTKITKISFKHGLEGCVGEFWTTGLKVEVGNKVTDYSDSILDVQSRLTSVEFKITPDGIFSTVSESSSFNATMQPNQGDYAFENGVGMWKQDHALTTNVAGATIVADAGEFGKNVIQITGEKWLFYNRKIPISTARTYRIKMRVRQTADPSVAGNSKIYAGIASYNASKTPITTTSFGSHRYCATYAKVIAVTDGWVEFEGTIQGEGNDDYGQFIAGTKYITPMCIVNYANGSGTVQIDYLSLEDITDINALAVKVETVQQAITAQGITTTIKSSDFYNEYSNAVGGKVDTELLTNNYMNKTATEDAIDNIDVTGKVDALLDDENSKIRQTFATQYQLEETATNMTAKFSATGGMNIIKNSVGYADFITKTVADSGEMQNWFVQGLTTRVTRTQEASLETLGFGSGFQFNPHTTNTSGTTSINQYINVIPNQVYTLSWYIKKTNLTTVATGTVGDGEFKMFINEFNSPTFVPLTYSEIDPITSKVVDKVVNEYKYAGDYVTDDFESFHVRFTPTTNKVHITAYGFAYSSVVLTGLMCSIGDMALQWSLATGESYNTNVRMDISGIRVSQLEIVDVATGKKEERGYTRISPDEFAGYYDVTGDGIPDKVFWLNGDELVARRVKAEAEITMGSIKIVKLPSEGSTGTTYVGWAFIPND